MILFLTGTIDMTCRKIANHMVDTLWMTKRELSVMEGLLYLIGGHLRENEIMNLWLASFKPNCLIS